MDLEIAMEEYVATMEEMLMAQEMAEEDIVNKWEQLNLVAKNMFRTVKLNVNY